MHTIVRRVLIPLALLLAACQPSTATPPARVFPTPLLRQVPATASAAPAPASAAPAATTRAPAPPAELPAAVREQLAPIGSLDTPIERQADGVLSAPVLLVAEPTHGAHEFAVLRERLIKQRLQTGGLIVFLETDWGSALALDEYVAYDRGDAQSAVAMQSNGWNSDELLEMVNLLHAHNRDLPLKRRARILGFDAGRPALLMDAVEAFAQRTGDAELLRQIRQHYACLRPYARISTGYADLPVSATSECRAELQAVPVALGRSVHVGSDVESYISAKMSATMVLQAEDLMMTGDTPDARALRTRYQADNIAGVVRMGARVVAFVRTHQADLAAQTPRSIGALLREQFGGDVRAVALTHARGSFLARRGTLESNGLRVASTPPAGAFESAFAATEGAFVLQTHTTEATSWLAAPRLFRAGSPRYEEADPETHFAPLALARSFDAIIFVPEVTPATLLAPGPTAGLFPAPRNLDFEDGTEGWWTFTGNPLQYAFGADLREPHGGMYSLSLGSEGSARVPTRRGTVGQTVSAARFRGKRLRVSAFLRTQAVEQQAGLIVAMSPARSPTFALAIRDGMTGRELRGTTPWQRHDIVVDVPNTEMSLAFGVWLDGRGTVWMDDVRVEAVGEEIATTYGTGLPGTARNLGFHSGVEGWNVEANVWSEWEFKAGAGVATLASTVTRTDGGAAAQQAIGATPYRGRTLRLSGMVRGVGVRGGAGLMLSASSARMVWNAERPTPPGPGAEWIRQSVQLDVPETADIVHLELWLDGRGRLEVKDLALEILAP